MYLLKQIVLTTDVLCGLGSGCLMKTWKGVIDKTTVPTNRSESYPVYLGGQRKNEIICNDFVSRKVQARTPSSLALRLRLDTGRVAYAKGNEMLRAPAISLNISLDGSSFPVDAGSNQPPRYPKGL